MTSRALAALLVVASVQVADAQERRDETRPGTTVVPGNYDATGLKASLLGSGWRDVWTTPVSAPLFDLDARGLKFDKRGGGNQSIVLHLTEKDGWREYRYRSVNKFPTQGFPAFRGTLVGSLMQDQVSVYFPGAPLMVPPLLRSIGAISLEPQLHVLAPSEQLGALSDTVAGMLGTFELKAQEGPEDTPGFAGSTSIKGTENFLEDLASSREHRLDEREFLAVRFVDMLINDPDRTPDNFDWMRFGEKGAYTWRPLAIDRDQAFIDARGLLNTLVVNRFFAKQIPFTPSYDLSGLTYSTHALDRRLLQRLDADDFRDIAMRVQRSITDDVIAQAVGQLPAEWRAGTTADERLVSVLRQRREGLPAFAMEYYHWLASEVDVFGTAEADRIEVVRHADGRVSVSVTDPVRAPMIVQRSDGSVVTISGGEVATGDTTPYYFRTFVPGETNEVRVYAGDGNDVAVVRGAATGPITVRVIGEKGDDVLADSAGGRTAFYDADGDNRLHLTSETRVNTRPWKPVEQVVGLRIGTDWVPDWGRKSGWTPALDYNTGSGLILGAGRTMTKYGFRRIPYHWKAGANLLVGTGNGRLGVSGFLDYRAENAPRGFRVDALATQLEDTRFFGYGNDTPELARNLSLVDQNIVSVEPAFVRYIGWRARETGERHFSYADSAPKGIRPTVGELRLGPVLGFLDADPTIGSPMAAVGGSRSLWLTGARLALELDKTDDDAVPTRGWTIEGDVAAYPTFDGLDDSFGTARTRASMYLPLGRQGGPHLAFRAGGAVATGAYPAHFAAALGGRSSLRGFSYRRFAGDAAANGGVELRVPVGTINFLVRPQLGVFALADAGRVWFDGASNGGWHTGVGGGFWLAAFGKAVSVSYANGEGGRFYVKSGLSY